MIRAGDWDVTTDIENFPFEELNVTSISIHPDYNNVTLINDAALLYMDGEFTAQPNVDIACLPTTPRPGAKCYTTGWGKDAFGKSYSDI